MFDFVALLNRVEILKPVAWAFWVTSGILLWSPVIPPQSVVSIPATWLWIVAPVFIFTSALLVFWFFPKLVKWARKAKLESTIFDRLTKEELRFLKLASTITYNPISIDGICSKYNGLTKLKLIEITDCLEEKGYVKIFSNRDYVALTPKGKRYIRKHFPI